jgi:hypothetical protein
VSITLDVYAGLFVDDLDAVAERLNEAKINASADCLRTKPQVIKSPRSAPEGENAV